MKNLYIISCKWYINHFYMFLSSYLLKKFIFKKKLQHPKNALKRLIFFRIPSKQDGARIAFLIIGTLFSVYFMITEIMEVLKSRKKFEEWKEWRLLEIKKDIHNCHPKWPDVRK